jgi:hypothetical protein
MNSVEHINVQGNARIQIGNSYTTVHNHAEASRSLNTRCFVVPFSRNENVIRRGDLFSKLEALLPIRSTSQSAALWGLGGSG